MPRKIQSKVHKLSKYYNLLPKIDKTNVNCTNLWLEKVDLKWDMGEAMKKFYKKIKP